MNKTVKIIISVVAVFVVFMIFAAMAGAASDAAGAAGFLGRMVRPLPDALAGSGRTGAAFPPGKIRQNQRRSAAGAGGAVRH